MDAASFTDVDAEVLAVKSPPSDAEIAVERLVTEDLNNDNDDAIETKDEPMYCRDRDKHLQIIETIIKSSLLSKDGAIVQFCANHVARKIDQHFVEKKRQITIRDYFQSLQKIDSNRIKILDFFLNYDISNIH